MAFVSVTLNTNMNSFHLFPIVSIFIFLIVVPPSYCDDHYEQLSACRIQHLYRCGRSAPLNISYPFWGGGRPPYCGRNGFEIKCDQDKGYHFIEFDAQKFIVLNITYNDRRMTIARADLWDDYCPGIITYRDTVFDKVHFKYDPKDRNLSFFYDCGEEISPQRQDYFRCNVHGEVIAGFYAVDTLQSTSNTCKRGIKVPVILVAFLPGHLGQALKRGFIVEYNADNMLCAQCLATRGICASNKSNSEQFICLCPDKSQPQTCPLEHPHARKPNRRLGVKLLAGFVSAIGGLTIIFVVICIFKRKNSSIITTETFWKRTKNDRDLEAFIRNYGSLAPKRHSFSNLKKITDSFKNKLGQGGYGGVYKGKLQDGQLVAVKLLNTSKGNGQEFINEVASISRTSHVNVVRLLGFCLEGSKRALIYEFMSNGSLEKFIHSTSSSTLKTNQHLGWEKLYQIALGIARGLEYLHRGCNTRILHFDIKPHNILLDEDFCPKIADFGLAKLCPKKESNVSLLEARGTIGYIAPEIYNRNFGEVSHKSDVYSYGMMVIEMVGGRKNLHLEVENSSEIYFPKWIYKHLDLHKEIKLQDSMTSEEDEIAKKMIIVGLWCIQTLPPDRPSMNKVIDMLQGSIEALQIPPDPFHSSSPRPTSIDSSTISIS